MVGRKTIISVMLMITLLLSMGVIYFAFHDKAKEKRTHAVIGKSPQRGDVTQSNVRTPERNIVVPLKCDDLVLRKAETLNTLLKSDASTQMDKQTRYAKVDRAMAEVESASSVGDNTQQIFAGFADDKNEDVVVRDYALQSLSGTLLKYAQQSKDWFKTLPAKDALDVFWKALDEKKGTLAGTAMIALCNIMEKVEGTVDREKLVGKVLEIASGSDYSDLSKITSYQICARLCIKDAREVLVAAVNYSSHSYPLKISAINALGVLGNKDDKLMLEKMSNDRILKPAIEAALMKYKERDI